MIQWMDAEDGGRLIFDERACVYYEVIPYKPPATEAYRVSCGGSFVYSGKITFYLKAHEPFGRMLYTSYEEEDTDGAAVYSGIIRQSEMPQIDLSAGRHLVYNPGTKKTDLTLKIAGTAPNGLTIHNATTGETCTLLMLVDSPNWVEINSHDGSIRIQPSDEDNFAFELHDLGYVTLAPCTPFTPDVTVSYEAGSNIVTHDALLTQETVGQYMRVGEKWLRIIAIQDETHVVVSEFVGVSGANKTCVVTMNEIDISGKGLSLTMLEFEYEPKVR